MGIPDYYAALGLPPDAEPDEIKAAYRNLVKIHHPDFNPDDQAANERFLEVKDAYEILSDPEQREAYDREYVRVNPEYELEGDDEEEEDRYWEQNPPASMPIVHDEEGNVLLRILLVLVLPIVLGGLVMELSGNVTYAILAAVTGLTAAIWISASLKDG